MVAQDVREFTLVVMVCVSRAHLAELAIEL
jgi:hypothetical protein